MSRKGFDPTRAREVKRGQSVIPQILTDDPSQQAHGFTEIKVVGLGSAGSNALDRMVESGVQGVDLIAMNTDRQALENSTVIHRLQLGERVTQGLGTGGDPKAALRAVEWSLPEIEKALQGADMIFLTAGLGGGTGGGASARIAEAAAKTGALTVAMVTTPFSFEGPQRARVAQQAIKDLRPVVDSLIVISNDRLLQSSPKGMGIRDSFRHADETLHQGIRAIADLILIPGLINLDFADVRTVMQRAGPALMATATATGVDRALRATEAAISNPLLEASFEGARSVLVNVTGGQDLTLHEVNTAVSLIQQAASEDANIIFGAVNHSSLQNELRITVIATGFGQS